MDALTRQVADQPVPASLQKKPLPAVRRQRRWSISGYLFLSPWIVGFLVLTLGPMLASLYLSLTNFELLGSAQFVGLANYQRMFFSDMRFVQSLKVTVLYVLFSVPLKLVFALCIALLLNRQIRGVGIYRAIYYLPSLLGGSVAIAIMWRQVFSYNGLLNEFLLTFGIDAPSWISNPDYALDTLVALAVWQFGSPMIIFLAGLKQIPKDLYEASAIDGAGKITQFVQITLPMLTPIVFFNFVMQVIGSFQAFTPSFIISNGTGGPADSTLFYTLYLYQVAFGNFQMGYGSALAWFLLGIIATATALAFLSSRYWVFYEDSGS
jgi:multiple sugar transport system permease protein